MKKILIAALVLMLTATAFAMPVILTGNSLETTADYNGEEYPLKASAFQLLGTDEDGRYLIFADSKILSVDAGAIQGILSAIDTTLPSITDYETLRRGSRGEAVSALQSALITLGRLNGSADGDFGRQSESAVSDYQESIGLEATGEADPALQMLLSSLTATPVRLDGSSPADQYDVMEGKTSANLQRAIEMGLTLTYDDIDGTGRIGNNASVTYSAPALAEVDRRDFTISFALGVNQGGDGMMTVEPVMDISCACTQRPAVESVLLKSGDERYTVEIGELTNSISGLSAVEKGTAVLDQSIVDMLAKCAEVGELKIRIYCKYDTYDVVVGENEIAKIATVAQAAKEL